MGLAVADQEAPQEDAQEETQEVVEAHATSANEARPVGPFFVGAPLRRRLSRSAAAPLLALALLGSCAPDRAAIDAAALEGTSPHSFRGPAGSLEGRLFGPDDATAGVVLAHGLSADQSSWFTFADRLGDGGYRVLTFNFRGYCPAGDLGCSAGERDVGSTPEDLAAAVRTIRADGVRRLAIVGSSMGGTASLVLAADLGEGIDGVAALSAPTQIEDLAAGPDVLARISAAKLFIAGNEDTTAAQAAETFFNESQQPKTYEILTTSDHGAAILRGNQGERARDLIETWLAAHVPVVEPSAA